MEPEENPDEMEPWLREKYGLDLADRIDQERMMAKERRLDQMEEKP